MLTELKTELSSVSNSIKSNVSFFDAYYAIHLFTSSNDKLISKIKNVQNLKLTQLTAHQHGHDPDDVIYNYSSYILNDIEKSVLTKGLNYALPPKKLKYENYILPFELLYRSVKDDTTICRQDLMHLR